MNLTQANKEKKMANRLQELRAKLQEKETKQSSFAADNAIYPFWNIPENTTAQIRFLPDKDETNDFFWVERQMIRLPFAGVVGQTNTNNRETIVQVPCMEMWSETCPVLTEIRPWFKDTSLEDLARKYWKKRSYIFQGFVRENPLKEDDGPENPVRRFVINPSIFDIIKAALMDPDMEEIPTDFEAGTDFRLIRTKQGEFSSYKTSSYSRKTSSLSPDEREAVETYGLFNLSDYLPKKPGEKEVQAIAEMFEASVNGELYDPSRWADSYKPAGLDYSSDKNSSVTSQLKDVSQNTVSDATDNVSTDQESNDSTIETVEQNQPAQTTTPVKKSPKDILADIKAKAEQQRD